uniref:Uncharacterized protein n=1 Tax=Rhizophora mucronata TaxID=61149 RepID=A0A2P2N399_RHIMU
MATLGTLWEVINISKCVKDSGQAGTSLVFGTCNHLGKVFLGSTFSY